MGDKYNYEINTEKLDPPLGENRYAATVIMAERLGPGQTQRVNPNIGELWGKTQEEAEKKLQQAVEKWIAERT